MDRQLSEFIGTRVGLHNIYLEHYAKFKTWFYSCVDSKSKRSTFNTDSDNCDGFSFQILYFDNYQQYECKVKSRLLDWVLGVVEAIGSFVVWLKLGLL